MSSDWIVFSSSKILLIVIGRCFSQCTPTRGVMSFLCVMSIGNFVVSPLYPVFTQILPKNLISFLFTSRYLFCNGWIYFCFIECWVVRHYGYGGSSVDCEVLIFPVHFQFEFVVVVFIRLYSVDLRFLSDFFGFTFFFFVAVTFLGVVFHFFPCVRFFCGILLQSVPVCGSYCILPTLPGICVVGSNFVVRKIRNRFSFVLVSRYMCFCLVGIFVDFLYWFLLYFFLFYECCGYRGLFVPFFRSCPGLPDPLLF